MALVSDHPLRDVEDEVAHWRDHDFGPWIVEERTGRVVGMLEVNRAGLGIGGIEPHEVELGWAIVEERQGRGYATEAASAAAADAFARLDVPRLVAYIRPGNEPSTRVAAKLGMVHVADGTARSGEPMRIYHLPRPAMPLR